MFSESQGLTFHAVSIDVDWLDNHAYDHTYHRCNSIVGLWFNPIGEPEFAVVHYLKYMSERPNMWVLETMRVHQALNGWLVV